MDTVRLNRLHALLWTALDSDEEYLYQGEMSDYARSYAVDGGMELRELLRATPPDVEEVALIVEALAAQERRERCQTLCAPSAGDLSPADGARQG